MLDLDILARSYFWFDLPVPYRINKTQEIYIYPITVKQSEMFLSWINILSIDKNSLPDAEYISMSYLEFLVATLLTSDNENLAKTTALKLASIIKVCLGIDGEIIIKLNDRDKPYLSCGGIDIDGKHFEDIRRIILYQNLIDFDDNYINPDVKQAIEEVEQLKNKNIEMPNLERRMAIITAHCGLSKETQMNMTYRSHCLLFNEVYGEVDYTSVRTAVLIGNMFSKQKNELEDWIYKKKHGKYDAYFTDVDTYQKSMGGQGNIHSEMVSEDSVNRLKDLIN